MVSPVGGIPAPDPDYLRNIYPSSWNKQVDEIDDDIIAQENSRALERIDDLIHEIESYHPQSPNLKKAVSCLKETAELVSVGNPIEAVQTLYEAKRCFSS